MDKINEYIKNLNMKNAILNGFDKESVFVALKELISLFEKELDNSFIENQQLKDKIFLLNQQSVKQSQNIESEQLKLIMNSYYKLEQQVNILQNEIYKKEEMIQKLESQLEENQELKTYHNEEKTRDYQQQKYHFSMQSLTQELYKKNHELVLENIELKKQLQQADKLDQSDDIEKEMQSLIKSMNRMKEKYIKED